MDPYQNNSPDSGQMLPPRKKVVQPLHGPNNAAAQATPTAPVTSDPTVDSIRQKIHTLYVGEPNPEEASAANPASLPQGSKHQQYMQELNRSGLPSDAIQAKWHAYYAGLTDTEKHEVWQEFNDRQNRQEAASPATTPQPQQKPDQPETTKASQATSPAPRVTHAPHEPREASPGKDPRTVADVKEHLLGTIQRQATRKKHPHMQSLLFGLGMGGLTVIILLFGFFNERVIAPFINPSRTVSATQIIVDPATARVGPEPKVIIPKINLEIPVVYDEPSIEEAAVQRALEQGVLHYATTPNPGQPGNAVLFGHSSSNIFNNGKYKFAFVLLNRLQRGDKFMLQHNSRIYVYEVFERKIVSPSEVSVLNPVPGKTATATLITCDPPGSSVNRLVVIGEQVSPKPSGRAPSPSSSTRTASPRELPSNSPSLWSRIF